MCLIPEVNYNISKHIFSTQIISQNVNKWQKIIFIIQHHSGTADPLSQFPKEAFNEIVKNAAILFPHSPEGQSTLHLFVLKHPS